MSATVSSYVPSLTDATATRNADVLPLTFPARPQVMTVYMRFVEMGSVLNNGATARIFHVGASDDSDARLVCDSPSAGGAFRLFHGARGGSVIVTLAVAPSLGDRVELRALLNADGSIQLHQSINSAAETSTAASSAQILAPTWSAPLIWLNSTGTDRIGFIAFRNVLIHRGVQTLETMRRLASV